MKTPSTIIITASVMSIGVCAGIAASNADAAGPAAFVGVIAAAVAAIFAAHENARG